MTTSATNASKANNFKNANTTINGNNAKNALSTNDAWKLMRPVPIMPTMPAMLVMAIMPSSPKKANKADHGRNEENAKKRTATNLRTAAVALNFPCRRLQLASHHMTLGTCPLICLFKRCCIGFICCVCCHLTKVAKPRLFAIAMRKT